MLPLMPKFEIHFQRISEALRSHVCAEVSYTYTVLGVETGPVHHQQLDHLEPVYSHRIVHGRVSVLQSGSKQIFSMNKSQLSSATVTWHQIESTIY